MASRGQAGEYAPLHCSIAYALCYGCDEDDWRAHTAALDTAQTDNAEDSSRGVRETASVPDINESAWNSIKWQQFMKINDLRRSPSNLHAFCSTVSSVSTPLLYPSWYCQPQHATSCSSPSLCPNPHHKLSSNHLLKPLLGLKICKFVCLYMGIPLMCHGWWTTYHLWSDDK